MRYVIVGAGAIGGVLGARLAQHAGEHGHPPLLIARGGHGAAIAERGLRLRSPDDDLVVRVDVASGPEAVRLHADDVIVLATKTHQADEALRQWVDQPVHAEGPDAVGTAGELLPVFTALNGVASERMALRYFARVFGVTVWMPAVHLEPGEVVVRIAPTSGSFIVGRVPASAADDSDRAVLETLARDWRASSFDVHVVDDVLRWKHAKLLANLGNAVQALVGPEGAPAIVAAVREEARAVYTAAGVDWASEEEERRWRSDTFRVRPVPDTPDELGGSTWQSLARGSRALETDYLNGEIAYLAHTLGRRAPLNEALQRIARRAAAEGVRAGSLTEQVLGRLLGLA